MFKVTAYVLNTNGDEVAIQFVSNGDGVNAMTALGQILSHDAEGTDFWNVARIEIVKVVA